MSDYWKCPHCQRTQEKTDQLKIMAEAKRTNAVFFANVTTRAYPCRFCRQTVDIGELANGKFDSQVVAAANQSESRPMNPVAGFFVGGLLGLVGSGVLNLIWRIFSSTSLPGKVVLILVGIGAVGFLIISLIERRRF